MWALIKRTFQDSYLTFFIYLAISILFVWMFISIFPSFQTMSEKFAEVLKNYPQGLMKAFGVDPDAPIFGTVETFLSIENFSFMYQVVIIGLIVSFASWAIAGQIEKKTMSLLLSLPLNRIKIFFSKYLSNVFLIIIFNAVSIYSIILFCKFYDINYDLPNYHKMFVASALFSMAIYALAMFFSSIFREKGKTIFFATGIVLIMYALNIISGLKDNLINFKYASFFYYYNATSIFAKGIIPDHMYLIFGSTIIVFTVLALVIFSKRDISV